MTRDDIRKALAEIIEREMDRGISFWSDAEWNIAARRYVGSESPDPAPSRGATPRPAPARTATPRAATAPPPAASRPAAPASPSVAPKPAASSAPAKAANRPAFPAPPQAVDRKPQWEADLARLSRETLACKGCGLHETRTNAVFASGNGRVPLVFIGEAPGADEDAQGEAFVGRAGQLLTKIIAAIGLDRKEVYICNVLKCRPPGNRVPHPEEIQACRPFLERQLEILKPRAICALGLTATQWMLESKAPMGQLRGRIFRYREIPLLPTYHPAALLRNPALKRAVWEDMLVLRKLLDEGPPVRSTIAPVPEANERKPRAESGDLFA